MPLPNTTLERHLMRELTLRQSPACLQILGQGGRFLDSRNNGCVDILLICCPRFWQGLLCLWLSPFEEFFFC